MGRHVVGGEVGLLVEHCCTVSTATQTNTYRQRSALAKAIMSRSLNSDLCHDQANIQKPLPAVTVLRSSAVLPLRKKCVVKSSHLHHWSTGPSEYWLNKHFHDLLLFFCECLSCLTAQESGQQQWSYLVLLIKHFQQLQRESVFTPKHTTLI